MTDYSKIVSEQAAKLAARERNAGRPQINPDKVRRIALWNDLIAEMRVLAPAIRPLRIWVSQVRDSYLNHHIWIVKTKWFSTDSLFLNVTWGVNGGWSVGLKGPATEAHIFRDVEPNSKLAIAIARSTPRWLESPYTYSETVTESMKNDEMKKYTVL